MRRSEAQVNILITKKYEDRLHFHDSSPSLLELQSGDGGTGIQWMDLCKTQGKDRMGM